MGKGQGTGDGGWWRVGWGLARLDWRARVKVATMPAQGVQLQPAGGGGDVVWSSGLSLARTCVNCLGMARGVGLLSVFLKR